MNNRKSNIRNNGEYFYIVKNIRFCTYSNYYNISIIIEIIILSFQS